VDRIAAVVVLQPERIVQIFDSAARLSEMTAGSVLVQPESRVVALRL
jgi:hypothetical protein